MVSVTVNQPLIQTSETHTSPYDDSGGRGGWEERHYGRVEKAGTGHTQ